MHWLIFQSLYRIGALCPYCMVVWVVTAAVFWYVTVHNLHRRHLPVPARLAPQTGFAVRNHSFVLMLWYVAVAVLIGIRFWSYWRTLPT